MLKIIYNVFEMLFIEWIRGGNCLWADASILFPLAEGPAQPGLSFPFLSILSKAFVKLKKSILLTFYFANHP